MRACVLASVQESVRPRYATCPWAAREQSARDPALRDPPGPQARDVVEACGRRESSYSERGSAGRTRAPDRAAAAGSWPLPRPGSSAPRSGSLPAGHVGFTTAQNTSVCACVCVRERASERRDGGGGRREAGQKNQGEGRRKKEVLTRVYPHTALAPLSHKYPLSPPTPHFFFFFFGVTSPVRLLSLSDHDISFLGAGSLPWSWKQWKRGNRNASLHSLGCRHPGERARLGEWDQVPAVGLRFCRAPFFSGVLLGARVG